MRLESQPTDSQELLRNDCHHPRPHKGEAFSHFREANKKPALEGPSTSEKRDLKSLAAKFPCGL